MTIPLTPGFAVAPLTLLSPANGITMPPPIPKLVWATSAANYMPGMPVHFQVQTSANPNFTTIAEEELSWVNPAPFEYESSPGVWTPLPIDGLPELQVGKNVRCNLVLGTAGTYYWRVRIEQFFDTTAPIPGVDPTLYLVGPWIRGTGGATVDSNSAAMMTRALAIDPADSAPYGFKFPNFTFGSFCEATQQSAVGSPTFTIPLDQPTWACGLDPNVPVPAGTLSKDPAFTDTDMALSIYDPVTNRIHDMWKFRQTSPSPLAYAAGSGCSSTPPNNSVGPIAAQVPARCGIIRPGDIAAGRIPHAIRFTCPDVLPQPGFRYPAKQSDGASANANAMPMGVWLQLDPAASLTGLSVWEQVIGNCLKEFGGFCTDSGGSFAFQGENRINYGGVGDWQAVGVGNGTVHSVNFSGAFPWNQCRFLVPPVNDW